MHCGFYLLQWNRIWSINQDILQGTGTRYKRHASSSVFKSKFHTIISYLALCAPSSLRKYPISIKLKLSEVHVSDVFNSHNLLSICMLQINKMYHLSFSTYQQCENQEVLVDNRDVQKSYSCNCWLNDHAHNSYKYQPSSTRFMQVSRIMVLGREISDISNCNSSTNQHYNTQHLWHKSSMVWSTQLSITLYYYFAVINK